MTKAPLVYLVGGVEVWLRLGDQVQFLSGANYGAGCKKKIASPVKPRFEKFSKPGGGSFSLMKTRETKYLSQPILVHATS
jgi:hypothetical protein